MPTICNKTINQINELYKAYETLPWYKKLFYPKPLRQALEQYHKSDVKTGKQIANIYKAFLNDTWSFQRFFFISLFNFSKLDSVIVFTKLNEIGLLNGKEGEVNFELAAGHANFLIVTRLVNTLYDKNLLQNKSIRDNFGAILRHKTPVLAAYAIIQLDDLGFLDNPEQARAYCDAVVSHTDPFIVLDTFHILKSADLLNSAFGQANRDTIISYYKQKHNSSGTLLDALGSLNNGGLLTSELGQTNFNNLLTYFAILCSEQIDINWHDIRLGELTQPSFDRMIATAKEHVDQQTAKLRFYTLINKEVINYLHDLRNRPLNDEDKSELQAIVNQGNGLPDGLWQRISVKISEQLLTQFDSLYDDVNQLKQTLLIHRDAFELPDNIRALALNIVNSPTATSSSSSSSSSFFPPPAAAITRDRDESDEAFKHNTQHTLQLITSHP